jgi:hypothetical protein
MNREQKMSEIKRFASTRRFRVIVGSACFYSTAGQIRSGVGDLVQCNDAVRSAMEALEYQRSGLGVESCAVGLAGVWEGLNVQLNLA